MFKKLGIKVSDANHAFRKSLVSNVLIPAGGTPANAAKLIENTVETINSAYNYEDKDYVGAAFKKLSNFKVPNPLDSISNPKVIEFRAKKKPENSNFLASLKIITAGGGT